MRRSGPAPRHRAPLVNGVLIGGATLAFVIVGLQVLSLGLVHRTQMSMSVAEPISTSFSRPDIVEVQVQQVRGENPVQFSLTYRWEARDAK